MKTLHIIYTAAILLLKQLYTDIFLAVIQMRLQTVNQYNSTIFKEKFVILTIIFIVFNGEKYRKLV